MQSGDGSGISSSLLSISFIILCYLWEFEPFSEDSLCLRAQIISITLHLLFISRYYIFYIFIVISPIDIASLTWPTPDSSHHLHTWQGMYLIETRAVLLVNSNNTQKSHIFCSPPPGHGLANHRAQQYLISSGDHEISNKSLNRKVGRQ